VRPRIGPGFVLLTIVLAGLVVFAAWGAWASWRLAGDAPMSVHGYVAMAIAGFFTALLTGGLIWLAFYSARRGFDDDQRY
jgi:dolichyl-phosphate-mannose--protein O-mannosyl transferase